MCERALKKAILKPQKLALLQNPQRRELDRVATFDYNPEQDAWLRERELKKAPDYYD
jgi:hypothetical protein